MRNETGIEKKIDLFLDHLRISGLSEKSIDTYGYILNNFKGFCKKHPVDLESIGDEDIKKFISFLKKRGLSPSTIKQTLNRVKEFIQFLGYDWNINSRIYREREKKESANPFTKEELEIILSYTKRNYRHFYYLILVLYGFGLRISEAVNLSPSDIVVESGNVFVRVRSDIAKFSKSREAPLILTGEEKNNLLGFVNRMKGNEYLFIFSIKGRRVKLTRENSKLFFNRLSKKLGLHITAHKFRDSYVSHLVSKGLKPSIVAKWVGHEDINTTLKYYTKLTTKDELLELQKIF